MMHTNFAYLFAILSILHLFTINWKTFWSYIKSKMRSGLNRKTELIFASLLTLIVFLGIIYGLPPFSSVMDIGENLKEGWEEEYTAPPVPHAEEFTIVELSEDILKVPEAIIFTRLAELGIEVDSNNQNLKELAMQVALSPQDIYSELSSLPNSGGNGKQQGGGMGRKSLQQIADENSIRLEDILLRLENAGIHASEEDVIRDLANSYNLHPSEIMTIVNVSMKPENH